MSPKAGISLYTISATSNQLLMLWLLFIEDVKISRWEKYLCSRLSNFLKKKSRGNRQIFIVIHFWSGSMSVRPVCHSTGDWVTQTYEGRLTCENKLCLREKEFYIVLNVLVWQCYSVVNAVITGQFYLEEQTQQYAETDSVTGCCERSKTGWWCFLSLTMGLFVFCLFFWNPRFTLQITVWTL